MAAAETRPAAVDLALDHGAVGERGGQALDRIYGANVRRSTEGGQSVHGLAHEISGH
jgi:hypothetical protein